MALRGKVNIGITGAQKTVIIMVHAKDNILMEIQSFVKKNTLILMLFLYIKVIELSFLMELIFMPLVEFQLKKVLTIKY